VEVDKVVLLVAVVQLEEVLLVHRVLTEQVEVLVVQELEEENLQIMQVKEIIHQQLLLKVMMVEIIYILVVAVEELVV